MTPTASPFADALRRCPPHAVAAAHAFRDTRALEHVAPIVRGIVERYTEPELRPLLHAADDGLRLVEDLAIDSLSLIQIAIAVEDVLEVTADTADLRQLRTLGDVQDLALRHVLSRRT
jgi:3-hydroxyacyl-[acyl-carrier-protein] dehydratase